MVSKKRTTCIKKCLAPADPTKQHEFMNTKNYIFILAGAALLVSCSEKEKSTASTKTISPSADASNGSTSVTSPPTLTATPSPTGTPVPCPGKRTEIGTVTGLTASQIRLQVPSISAGHEGAGTQGTFLIDRTDCTHMPGGTAVGSTNVTIEAQEGDWHLVPPA